MGEATQYIPNCKNTQTIRSVEKIKKCATSRRKIGNDDIEKKRYFWMDFNELIAWSIHKFMANYN